MLGPIVVRALVHPELPLVALQLEPSLALQVGQFGMGGWAHGCMGWHGPAAVTLPSTAGGLDAWAHGRAWVS